MIIKIMSGTHRGRRIFIPKRAAFRPTSHKVRKAVLDIASTRWELTNCRFLDYCAGSGAVGMEALSRSALHSHFVEQEIANVKFIERNLTEFGWMNSSRVTKVLTPSAGMFEIVFADPPYDDPCDLLLLSEHLAANGDLFYQSDSAIAPTVSALGFVKTYRYGRNYLHLYEKSQ